MMSYRTVLGVMMLVCMLVPACAGKAQAPSAGVAEEAAEGGVCGAEGREPVPSAGPSSRPARAQDDAAYPKALGFTPEQEREILAFVRRHFPDEVGRFARLQHAGVAEYRRALQSKWRLMRSVRNLDPHLRETTIRKYRAHRAKWRALSALRQTEDPDRREQLQAELREAVAEYFDAELILDAERIDNFEARVNARLRQLRDDLEQRIRERDEMIQERFAWELERMAEREKLANKPEQADAPASQPVSPER